MAPHKASTLPIISYNSTGWSNSKAEMLNTILITHGIMAGAIQEHMQLASNVHKLSSKLTDYDIFTIPAYKHSDKIHKGRPSGGLGLFYHKKLQNLVNHIVVPLSRRVHAMSVDIPGGKLVFINVYFPTDPRLVNFDDQELLKTFQDINFIFNECSVNDHFILLGDLNTDFSRNTGFVNKVKNFLEDNDLVSVWHKFPIEFTYCQTVTRNFQMQHSFSTIDHFITKEQFLNNCVEATVLHLAENISNHEIIYLKVNCPQEISLSQNESPSKANNLPNWPKATPEQIISFKNDLICGLSYVNVPDAALCCRSPHCDESQLHKEEIDKYALEVFHQLDLAVLNNIPKLHYSENKKDIPGWNQFIRPIRDDLQFWYNIWLSTGKQMNTVVHNIYRNIRKEYMYALRRVRKNENEIRNNQFLEAAEKGDMLDILQSLKRSRGTSHQVTPSVIDKVSGRHQICEHFKDIYENIYNKHSESTNLDPVVISIEDNIASKSFAWINKITPNLISKLISKLHSGKNDAKFVFKSDAFKLSSEIISSPLAKILTSFIMHGYVSEIFLSCSLVPLIKDKRKSKLISKNYRLIAISSILLKLLDLLLIELFGDSLSVSSMQFGFQSKSSPSLCTWTLKETVNYFVNQDCPVYVCLLDLTKAFDNIRLDILFEKLKKRLPSLFLRLLIYTYVNQQCSVKWDGSVSSSFNIGNGVRQGAVLSPILFNIYMDDIFTKLRDSNTGCKIDNLYYGAVGYADDFALLCPSRTGLQSMINLVKEYCEQHGIEISTDENILKSKTKCIGFNCPKEPSNVILYNRPLPWVDSHVHLGHTISKDEKSDIDILRNRAEFIGDVHALYQELGNTPPSLFLRLVNIYFSNFYGSVLWDLESNSAHKLYSTWNYNIRNAYELPFGTHRFILKELSNRPPLQVSFSKRFVKFCSQITNSARKEVLHLYRIQRYDLRSTFGKNYYNAFLNPKDYENNYRCPLGEEWKIPIIKELLNVKLGNLQIKCLKLGNSVLGEFTKEEINSILIELCCS